MPQDTPGHHVLGAGWGGQRETRHPPGQAAKRWVSRCSAHPTPDCPTGESVRLSHWCFAGAA